MAELHGKRCVSALVALCFKKKDVITSPDDYTNLFSDFGTTVPLAGIVYDRKTSVQSVFKLLGIGILVLIQQKDFYLKTMYKKLMF